MVKQKVEREYYFALDLIESKTWTDLLVPYLSKEVNNAIPHSKASQEDIVRNAYRAEMAKDLIKYIESCAKLANDQRDTPKILKLVALFSSLFTKGVK